MIARLTVFKVIIEIINNQRGWWLIWLFRLIIRQLETYCQIAMNWDEQSFFDLYFSWWKDDSLCRCNVLSCESYRGSNPLLELCMITMRSWRNGFVWSFYPFSIFTSFGTWANDCQLSLSEVNIKCRNNVQGVDEYSLIFYIHFIYRIIPTFYIWVWECFCERKW